MRPLATILLGGLALAACGKSHDTAQALDNAAAQSDPAAAAELNAQAQAIRNGEAQGDLADPGSSAQNAMQEAGDAAVENGAGR